MGFPNMVRDDIDVDTVLRNELNAAGIVALDQNDGWTPWMSEQMRRASKEVKSAVRGQLHGWHFERASIYWVASGPGIEVEAAEVLHAIHGQSVRVGGDANCPCPREYFKGLACGLYHVDTPEGLKALAETINALVAKASQHADVAV